MVSTRHFKEVQNTCQNLIGRQIIKFSLPNHIYIRDIRHIQVYFTSDNVLGVHLIFLCALHLDLNEVQVKVLVM